KDETEFQTHTARVTEPGQICKAMKAAGIGDVNPGHPLLQALLDAGATVEEFRSGALAAVKKQKGFSYALAVVKGTREDAAKAALAVHTGPMPVAQPLNRQEALEAANFAAAQRFAQQGEFHEAA
ncbi:MAG: hypothetical protein RJB68_2175, partial [Pseudomonadota bacterium]